MTEPRMYGQWIQKSQQLIEQARSAREAECARLAAELHAREHGAEGVDGCVINWHSDTWFRHLAERVYDSNREGR